MLSCIGTDCYESTTCTGFTSGSGYRSARLSLGELSDSSVGRLIAPANSLIGGIYFSLEDTDPGGDGDRGYT